MIFGNSQVDVQCPHCHVTFFVPTSMKGGLANCPDCKKAVDVRAGFEGLFWLLVTGGVVLSLFFMIGAYFTFGIVGAGAVFLVSAVIGTLLLTMA